MKKITLLLTSALFTTAAFSQMNFNYGIKAGANFSTLTAKPSGEVSSSTSYKVGFNAGGFVELGVGSGFTIQPELLFSQMGGKVSFTNAAGATVGEGTYNFNYLHLPILVKYGIKGVDGLSAFVGPQVGFLMSAKSTKIKVLGVDSPDEDVKNDLKGVDFAGTLGVEYKLPMGVVFAARYQYSFANILKEEADGKIVNSGITLNVGYAFGGKKK